MRPIPQQRVTLKHVDCCISDCLVGRLSSLYKVTAAANRFDCWEKAELYQGKPAVNIVIGNRNVTAPMKVRDPEFDKSLDQPELKAYRSTLDVTVEIYVTACDDPFCASKEAEAAILPVVIQKLPGTTRTRYTGSRSIVNQDKAEDNALIVIDLEVDHIFSPEKPYLML